MLQQKIRQEHMTCLLQRTCRFQLNVGMDRKGLHPCPLTDACLVYWGTGKKRERKVRLSSRPRLFHEDQIQHVGIMDYEVKD